MAEIRLRLQAAFAPTELDIVDEGYKHIGHSGEGKGHFHLHIVSASFAEQAPLRRHRMVYAALDDLMNNGIHALSIDARSE
ncbi:MAG: BolA family protein [Rhodanobacter sp.]